MSKKNETSNELNKPSVFYFYLSMRIGFYLNNISPQDGGIFQYSIYLLKMLLRCDQINQIYLFYSAGQQELLIEYFNDKKVTPVKYFKNNRLIKAMRQISEFWLTRYYMRINKQKHNLFFYKLFNPDRIFFNRFKIDLLHVPRQHSPVYKLKYPVIITMHDIQHFHFPEFFTSLERIHKAIRYHVSLKEADHIIVSYNHVKKDIEKYFIDETVKTSVCPVPLSDDWITSQATSPDVLRTKYNVPQIFILTPAATWQHKNHLGLLEALNVLRGEGLTVFWVATGFKTSFYENISKRILELKLQDQVLFTGIVPDNDLRGLYNIANLVVIPTFYEAGSGPLVEAMRYGVPVICSNVTSLPEMINNPDFIFNPLNILELASLIKRALTDQDFIERNKENSRKQIELLRNIDYTQPFLEAYSASVKRFNLRKMHG